MQPVISFVFYFIFLSAPALNLKAHGAHDYNVFQQSSISSSLRMSMPGEADYYQVSLTTTSKIQRLSKFESLRSAELLNNTILNCRHSLKKNDQQSSFHKTYLRHIYPTHNFW